MVKTICKAIKAWFTKRTGSEKVQEKVKRRKRKGSESSITLAIAFFFLYVARSAVRGCGRTRVKLYAMVLYFRFLCLRGACLLFTL